MTLNKLKIRDYSNSREAIKQLEDHIIYLQENLEYILELRRKQINEIMLKLSEVQ